MNCLLRFRNFERFSFFEYSTKTSSIARSSRSVTRLLKKKILEGHKNGPWTRPDLRVLKKSGRLKIQIFEKKNKSHFYEKIGLVPGQTGPCRT